MRVMCIINNNAHDMSYNVGTRAGPGHGPQARPARVTRSNDAGPGPARRFNYEARARTGHIKIIMQ